MIKAEKKKNILVTQGAIDDANNEFRNKSNTLNILE